MSGIEFQYPKAGRRCECINNYGPALRVNVITLFIIIGLPSDVLPSYGHRLAYQMSRNEGMLITCIAGHLYFFTLRAHKIVIGTFVWVRVSLKALAWQADIWHFLLAF